MEMGIREPYFMLYFSKRKEGTIFNEEGRKKVTFMAYGCGNGVECGTYFSTGKGGGTVDIRFKSRYRNT